MNDEARAVRPWAPVLRAIAATTLREALGNRVLWLLLVFVVVGFSAAEFIGEVAITESREIRAAFLGGFLRLCGVVMVSLFVVSSAVREFDEKGLELVLALPVPRWTYLAGKLLGFAQLALVTALAAAATLLLYAPWGQCLLWGLSFTCELVLVIALCLFCLLTFRHVAIAMCAVLGFYVAGRSIATLRLMTEGPFAQKDTLSQTFIDGFIGALAYLLPDLSRFSPSAWLVYESGEWAGLLPIVAQTAIYLALLVAASLFDLYRKNF